MKKLLVALLAIIMVFLVVSCGGNSEGSSESKDTQADNSQAETEAASSGEGKVLKVGISWAHYNDALFYAWGDGIEEVLKENAKDNGYDSVEIISLVAEDDASKQASDISDLVTQKCDLIIGYAFDNQAIVSSVKECNSAGIPIVLWDRNVAEGADAKPDLFVGLDTYNQAYLAGKEFFQRMIDEGETPKSIISIIGATNDNNALNRQKGFEDAASEFDLEVKQTVPSDWDAEKALTGFTAAYQANPDTNVVLVASDFIISSVQTVLQANDAWKPNGEEGHIWICTQDGFPNGCQFMLDGYADYSGMYNIEAMCNDFSDAIFEILKGTYSGESELYSDPLIVNAEDISDMQDLWGIKYAE